MFFCCYWSKLFQIYTKMRDEQNNGKTKFGHSQYLAYFCDKIEEKIEN